VYPSDTAACELKSGTIYPATFSDKGPDEDIRAAGLMVQETVCCVIFICINHTIDIIIIVSVLEMQSQCCLLSLSCLETSANQSETSAQCTEWSQFVVRYFFGNLTHYHKITALQDKVFL